MSKHIESFSIEEKQVGKRLDLVLCDWYPTYSRNAIQKMIDQGLVSFSGKIGNKKDKLKLGDVIEIKFSEDEDAEIKAENTPLNIVYEDEHLIVVNKPKGMVVHPAPGHISKTLVNALMGHCKENLSTIGGATRPGIVHRIDKDTSGLLIVAKTDEAHLDLKSQIQEHSFERYYEAVVYGRFKKQEGTVELPIGRSIKDRKKMSVTTKKSKEAITHYKVLEEFNGFSHVRLKLETGRTHQIRVHMSYIGHPVAGDAVYGPKKVIEKLDGQCLHAKSIGFVHPIKKEEICLESELPYYFKEFLEKCKRRTR